MNASNAALATLATAGIEVAQTAVLVVLGALIAFAAATYGTIKVLGMFGVNVAPPSSGTSTASVLDAEHADDRRAFEHEAKNDDSWGDEWSNASGTGSADVSKWRY